MLWKLNREGSFNARTKSELDLEISILSRLLVYLPGYHLCERGYRGSPLFVLGITGDAWGYPHLTWGLPCGRLSVLGLRGCCGGKTRRAQFSDSGVASGVTSGDTGAMGIANIK